MDISARLQQVYDDLRRVLDDPESFGLGDHCPEQLVSAVTAMRQELKEAIILLSDDNDLAAELSEDIV